MELTHSFTVPVGVDQAFEVLTDIERIAPCMPGASVDSVDGREFTGRVKVKVGPMQVTYRGKAKYAELDADNHHAIIEARGQETRGSGTANATITAELNGKGDDETEVSVVSDLAITGRPAQFGRGVMNEVGAKLLGQFADCLAVRLAEGEGADEEEEAGVPAASGAVGSNGDSASTSEQEITQQVGAATPQPASGATTAAATAAPSAAAATSGATPADATSATSPTTRTTTPQQTSEADVEPIDLFDVAGPSVAKRLAPLAVALLVLFLWWRRRRHS